MCQFKLLAVTLCAYLAAVAAWAEDQVAPTQDGPDTMPILRLDPGGPTSFVSSLAFNPQGTTLYAGGWDKVVRTWSWDEGARRFILDPAGTYRLPIGPALEGVVNAVAVSPDGLWLAAAGWGVVRGSSDMHRPGWKVPAAGVMDVSMREDQGVIYLFNTRTREARTLRGHTAPVVALAFAPPSAGKPLLLVSAGREWDESKRAYSGAVRAWDTQSGTHLGSVMLSDPTSRPGIAAWHTGARTNQLCVAIAWGDTAERLRIWDVESNTLRPAADGQHNHTAAWWAEGNRLITGSTGRLKSWNVAGQTPVVERELQLARLEVPSAVTLFSSRPGGAADRIAVVVKSDADAQGTVRVRVAELANFRLVDRAVVSLWAARGITQAVAAAPGGGQLAVAGNRTHEIATIATSDLLAGKNAPGILRGSGIHARQVSFARKGGKLGIVISREGKPALGAARAPSSGDLVFDPVERGVSNELAGWQLVRPAAGPWRADISSANAGASSSAIINVRQGDRVVRQIRPAKPLTSFALLPPIAAGGVPVVAAATQDLGQPLLQLYNAASGAVVRELSGHLAAIDWLAFSDDGKLLASTAGDRTVCVWNLADLDRVIGVRGALPGITFSPEAKGLRVAEIAAESPYQSGQLAAGDVLTGWARGQQVDAIGSIIDFYLHVSRVKPGETITLARQRGAAQPENIRLAVGQGTDERKPLFTLFVADGNPSSWIAWSPLGPYESSGRAIEQWLGWHFNTREPAQPARFATSGEYQHLRRDGLIEQLLGAGALPEEVPRPLERPEVSIRVKQPGRDPVAVTGPEPLPVLAKRDIQLELEIRGVAPELVQSVSWRAGDGSAAAMEAMSRQVWSAKLPPLGFERRATPITLTITTAEAEPQTFTEQISLRHQPSAPAISQVEPAAEHAQAKEATAKFTARVESTEGDNSKLKVGLKHTAGGREVASRELDGGGTLNVDEAFELQPGDNTITLVAAPGDALAEATDERAVLVRRITYNPESVPAAVLLVRAVSPSDGQRRTLASDQGQPLVVDTPALALEGQITGTKPLAKAEWSLNDKVSSFKGFTAGATSKIDVKEQVTLAPGKQRIACFAQSEGGLPAEASLAVEYRPRLGEVFLTAPDNGAGLIDGRDQRRVKVTGRIEPLADKRPFQAIVLVNGERSGEPAEIDAAGETFSTEIELADGDNRIEALLTNEWGASKTSEAIHVRYLRPPRVVEVSAPASVEAPLTDVSFIVESPSRLQLTGLKIDEQELPLDAAVAEREEAETTRWKVTAHDVPLRQGANEIRPLARNADGWSVLTRSAKVDVMKAAPPKAQVEFINPAIDRTVESPEIEVQFAVRSLSRLKHVELRGGQRRVTAIDVDQQVEQPTGDGKQSTFLLEATARVTLQPKENVVRLVAVNDGGESDAQRTITYVRKPVEVVIDRIESLENAGALVPEIREGGKLRFTSVLSQGNVAIEGRVRWPDAATQALNKVSEVEVVVNGFLQPLVTLKPGRASDLEWKWKAKIRLSRSDNNISLRLPGVAKAADNRLDFQVKCSKPDDQQRLHLLVVGVGEKNVKQLEALALRAVQGTRVSGMRDQITTPVFSKGWIYPVSGYVNRAKVSAQLESIHLRVDNPGSAGNDVVLVYFRGQESVDERGQIYLLTSQSEFDPDMRSSAVSRDDLSNRFRSVPGAQLFLFDVRRQTKPSNEQVVTRAAARWPVEPQMAALRYVWLAAGAAPPDARLLEAFDSAVPRGARLGKIEGEVSRDSQRARQKYGKSFEYEPSVPDALRDLVLAKVAME